MALNLHHLRVFHAVADQRSFTRAAASLFISQPAVSKAVRELESQLDLPLIDRGGSRAAGVRLTEGGKALFDHARGIFALERAAVDDVKALVGLRRGRLTVGASTTVAGYWLPPYLASLLERFPSIQLQVQVGNTQLIGQALIDCSVDIALVEGVVRDPRIVATRWQREELAIVSHPRAAFAHKRSPTPEELSDAVWLMREPGSGTREVAQRVMKTLGIAPKKGFDFGSNEGIARAVAAGAGVALLPMRVVRELAMVGEVQVLRLARAPHLERQLYLLQLRQRPAAPLVRAFIDLLLPTAN
jgi:DNA-binding transcriptional LysR family regulator